MAPQLSGIDSGSLPKRDLESKRSYKPNRLVWRSLPWRRSLRLVGFLGFSSNPKRTEVERRFKRPHPAQFFKLHCHVGEPFSDHKLARSHGSGYAREFVWSLHRFAIDPTRGQNISAGSRRELVRGRTL